MRSGVITFLGLNFSANMCYFLTFSRNKKKGQFLVNPIFFLGGGGIFGVKIIKKSRETGKFGCVFFHSSFNPSPFWYIFRTRILKFKRQACQFFITYGMNPGCGVENGYKLFSKLWVTYHGVQVWKLCTLNLSHF